MELLVISYRKVDLYLDVLEEKQENGCNNINLKEVDFNVLYIQEW